MTGAHVLLPGVDRAAFATALASQLRQRGARIGLTAVEDFVRAVAEAWPTTRTDLYWTARVCLVRRREDLDVFEAVFAAVFADAVLDVDPHARRTGPDAARHGVGRHAPAPGTDSFDAADGLPWVTLAAARAATEDVDVPVAVPERLPARLAGLLDTPFEQLSADDLAALGRWLRHALRAWPLRRSRRLATGPHGGQVALRPTIVRARRTGWEPLHLVRAAPEQQARRTVMLCDVSQSMQAQAAAYLHLMRALALVAHAEVFAFGTSLTRLTPALTHCTTAAAIERANATVTDRFGGTRIATNLATLLASHHGSALRGAVVIIGSDGWDSDPPEQLAAAMARLRRRAHRVVWLNPRAGEPSFEPRVASMAAALAHCDAMLPADTFAALADALRAISLNSKGSRGWTGGTARR